MPGPRSRGSAVPRERELGVPRRAGIPRGRGRGRRSRPVPGTGPHPPWAPIAGRAVRWSDLLSRRRLHSLDIYAEVAVPLGGEYQLELWLLTPNGVAGGFAFDRESATSASATWMCSTPVAAPRPALAERTPSQSPCRGRPAHPARARDPCLGRTRKDER